MHKRPLFCIAFAAAAVAVACSSTPTSFAGSYTVTVVDGPNACNLQNWTEGSSTSNIAVSFSQDGSIAQLNVQGLLGVYLLALEGSSVVSGMVTGDDFTATLLGTKTITQSACEYTLNTKLDVTLDSKGVLSGTLTYIPVITKSDPSCGALTTCTQQQTVSGSRTGP